MAVYGRSSLRNLFDESPTPHIAHPPRTHHRHFYVATDGSYRPDGGGLGVVIETRDGERVARMALPDAAPNNNVAEYRALHLGLDVLAARAPRSARVGVLVDLDDLAGNVNRTALAAADPEWTSGEVTVPTGSEHHWRGIRARIAGFDAIRAARIDGRHNPAHPLANTPDEYAHVNERSDRCVLPDPPDGTNTTGPGTPPPSRSERRTGH
jgi:hypothetical protein